MASRWASPESRMSAMRPSGIEPRSPVNRATATARRASGASPSTARPNSSRRADIRRPTSRGKPAGAGDRTRTRPTENPTAPNPWKKACRPKSNAPGRAGPGVGRSVARIDTRSPGRKPPDPRTVTRTRSGMAPAGRPSIARSSRTTRTPRGCVSIETTRPTIRAERIGSARTGPPTRWTRSCASAKPATTSAIPTAISRPRGSFRKAQARPAAHGRPARPIQPGGSPGNEKYPAMPIPRKTGIHRGQRSRSATRASREHHARRARRAVATTPGSPA